jgi:hypothetical protein
MRVILAAVALFALTSCGGGRVSGEIGQACMDAGRSGANARLCSCVQQAANQTLSGADQARAAAFFADPDEAQAVRQSDSGSAEAFWRRYREFTQTAEAMCSG